MFIKTLSTGRVLM